MQLSSRGIGVNKTRQDCVLSLKRLFTYSSSSLAEKIIILTLQNAKLSNQNIELERIKPKEMQIVKVDKLNGHTKID